MSKDGGGSLTISGDTVTMNGGAIGGMVIPDAITNAMNIFVSAFNSHTHAYTWSEAAGADTTAPPTGSVSPFKAEDYTNDKVQQ